MKKKILIIFAIAIFFAAAGTVWAAGGFGLNQTAAQAGYETSGTSASLTGRIEMIISTILGLVALGFFALTLYGGIIWLTARGKEEKVTQAKEILEAAVIGLIVISASYAIAKFVLGRLTSAADTVGCCRYGTPEQVEVGEWSAGGGYTKVECEAHPGYLTWTEGGCY